MLRRAPHRERTGSSCWWFRSRVYWKFAQQHDIGCNKTGGTGRSHLSARGLFRPVVQPDLRALRGRGTQHRTSPHTIPMYCLSSKEARSRSQGRHLREPRRQIHLLPCSGPENFPARCCTGARLRATTHLPTGTASAPNRHAPHTPIPPRLEVAYPPMQRTPQCRSMTPAQQGDPHAHPSYSPDLPDESSTRRRCASTTQRQAPLRATEGFPVDHLQKRRTIRSARPPSGILSTPQSIQRLCSSQVCDRSEMHRRTHGVQDLRHRRGIRSNGPCPSGTPLRAGGPCPLRNRS